MYIYTGCFCVDFLVFRFSFLEITDDLKTLDPKPPTDTLYEPTNVVCRIG